MLSFTFENNHKDLGTHQEGDVVNFSYIKTDTKREVLSLSPSCNCFNPVYIKEKGEVVVAYKVKGVPHHLKHQKSFIDKKHIVVIMDSGEKEVLTFQINVKV